MLTVRLSTALKFRTLEVEKHCRPELAPAEAAPEVSAGSVLAQPAKAKEAIAARA
jgi:hypothetical protein